MKFTAYSDIATGSATGFALFITRLALFLLAALLSVLAVNSPAFAQAVFPSLSYDRTSSTDADGVLQFGLRELQSEFSDFVNRVPGGTFQSANPVLPIVDDGQAVVVDAIANSNGNTLADRLRAIGMRDVTVAGLMVSGKLPLAAIPQLSSIAALKMVRPAYRVQRAGAVVSQGDGAMRADLARLSSMRDGSGVTVGTLSDSYDCLGGAAGDIAAGELPTDTTVVVEGPCPGSDEGRAMMQLIADVAPGATQLFHTAALGEAAFAAAIRRLADEGADIIVDDIAYLTEPFFQDGVVAQAIDEVVEAGIDPSEEQPPQVHYFTAAGNSPAGAGYDSAFRPSGLQAVELTGSGLTGNAHDFDPGPAVDVVQSITVPANARVSLVLQWDEPFFSVSGAPGSGNDLDLFLLDNALTSVLLGSVENNVGGDPVEILNFTNAGPTSSFNLVVQQLIGEAPPDNIKLLDFQGGLRFNEFDTAGPVIVGHSNAERALAIGAASYTSTPVNGVLPPVLEPFSSTGGTPIRFDTAGNTISEIVRLKPEMVAPDGTDTSFFGFDSDNNGNPNFFGTSAAAPHAAAAAALLFGDYDVERALRETAVDMDVPGVDSQTGGGLVDVLSAIGYQDLVLTNNEWVQFSLPAVPPAAANTLADIFPAAQLGTYGDDWVVFGWDPTVLVPATATSEQVNGGYFRLELDDTLEHGLGYWALQRFVDEIAVNLPVNSTQALTDKTVCDAQQWGCFAVVLNAAGPSIWNMIGNPFYRDGPAIDDLIVTTAGTPCNNGCTLTEATDRDGANLLRDQFWTWNASIGDYEQSGPGDELATWTAYWISLLADATGAAPELHIPR